MKLITGILLMFSLVGQATVPLEQANFNKEALEFFHDYIIGYNEYLQNKDDKEAMNKVASHFYMPFMIVPQKNKPTILASRAELSNSFTQFIDGQRSQGVRKLVWEKINVKPLTRNKALAINIVNALNAEGKVIARRSAMYVLYKSADQGWEIALLNTHDVNNHINLQ